MNSAPPTSQGRWIFAGAALLLLLHGLLAGASATRLDPTIDEPVLWFGGRALINGDGWESPLTRFQGPVALYANQLLTLGVDGATLPADGTLPPPVLARARFATLPFGLLAGAILFLWGRKLFGPLPSLFSLALFALHPVLLGYTGIATVDMAHGATVLLVLAVAWGFLERPVPARAVALGLAFGIALGTKYLAVLYAPIVLVALIWPALQSPDPPLSRGRRLSPGRCLLLLLTCSGTALVALHGCYGFQGGFADPGAGAFTSGALRGIADLGIPARLLGLLPAPWLAGVDYQASVGEWQLMPFLDGVRAAGHPDYYLKTLFYKTPGPTLALGAVALFMGHFLLLRRSTPRRLRHGALIVMLGIYLPFAYLSLFARLQLGIRYILPVVCLSVFWTGSLPVALPRVFERIKQRGPRARWLALAPIALTAVACLSSWPDGLGFYNRLAGGSRHGYLHFADSNSDWGQRRHSGLEVLKRREEAPFTRLRSASGPRLGRVAIYLKDLVRADPLQPSRPRHWLEPFRPVSSVGAGWFLFDVREGPWIAAARSDPRVGAELAIALLAEGRLDAARVHGGGILDGPARKILALRLAPDATDYDLANAWLAAGRADLSLQFFPGAAWEGLDPDSLKLVVKALRDLGRYEDGAALLSARPTLSKEPGNLLLLADLYRRLRRLDLLEEILGGHLARLPEPYATKAREALAATRSRVEILDAFEGVIRWPSTQPSTKRP